MTDSVSEAGSTAGGTGWRHVADAVFVAVLPAFGVHVLFGFLALGPVNLLFFVFLAAFARRLYRLPSDVAMIAKAFYWLAIELAALPVVAVLTTLVAGSAYTATSVGLAGASGVLITVVAFVLGLPLSVGLYFAADILSTESDGVEEDDADEPDDTSFERRSDPSPTEEEDDSGSGKHRQWQY